MAIMTGARAYSEAINPALTPDADESPPASRCGCGYDRDNHMVRAEPAYGFTAWMCMIVGVSARPERIAFRCRRCHVVIEESTASDVLEKAY